MIWTRAKAAVAKELGLDWPEPRLGFRIANRTKDVNGTRHSWFRLESDLRQAKPRELFSSASAATPASFPEFGSLAPESGHRDNG
jgi:hypothetical protein